MVENMLGHRIYSKWTDADLHPKMHSRYFIFSNVHEYGRVVHVWYDPNQLVLDKRGHGSIVKQYFSHNQIFDMAGIKRGFNWKSFFRAMVAGYTPLPRDLIFTENWSFVYGYDKEDSVQKLIVRSALLEFASREYGWWNRIVDKWLGRLY